MRLKINFRQSLLVFLIVELVILLVLVFLPNFISEKPLESDILIPTEIVTPILEQKAAPVIVPVGKPIRLKIPFIGVDAAVESVGLTSDGAMEIPQKPDGVAWLQLGPRPGEIGSAVIDGHYGVWKNGTQTVFNNLYKLQPGNKLSVEDDKGAVTTFIVRESKIYDPNADASSVFGSSDGKSHLNLITCKSWSRITESYSQRLVVFTDKE